ncbi:MAG: flagellar biosynthesis anti-sigma factor FlgM [Methylophilaceae bacterium]
MKINDSIKQPVDLTADKIGVNAHKKTEQTSTSTAVTENVTLSTLSSQVKSLEVKVAGTEVFDTEKVDAIKSAIASGQFSVDSGNVADGLISSVKDLLNIQK